MPHPTDLMPLPAYLTVSALMFAIGALGVLIRRNPLIIFMSIELMLNAVNLSFVIQRMDRCLSSSS